MSVVRRQLYIFYLKGNKAKCNTQVVYWWQVSGWQGIVAGKPDFTSTVLAEGNPFSPLLFGLNVKWRNVSQGLYHLF